MCGGPGTDAEAGEECAAIELSHVLAESRWAADDLLGLSHNLHVKLPGTFATLQAGELPVKTISRHRI